MEETRDDGLAVETANRSQRKFGKACSSDSEGDGPSDSDGDGSSADARRKRRRRGVRNWIAWERDSDDSSVTQTDLMARAMAEASAGVAPSLAPAPAPTSTPAPLPTPAPAQPPAANRATSDADQAGLTPWACMMKGCARPRRVRYRYRYGLVGLPRRRFLVGMLLTLRLRGARCRRGEGEGAHR